MLLPLGILASSGGAAAADYELISTTVLSSTASSVTFSSLGTAAAAYKHLQIRYAVRGNSVAGGMKMSFNSDTGANYKDHATYGDGSSVSSYGESVTGGIYVGTVRSSTSYSSIYAPGVIDILDFSSTVKNKTARSLNGSDLTGYNSFVYLSSGLWMNTAAITSVTLAENNGTSWQIGSRFSLYGLKG